MSILVDDSNKTACRAAEAGLQQKNCAALVRPAGTGKGCIVWELLDTHPEMRVLWVVSCAARLELRRALTKRLGRTLGGRVRLMSCEQLAVQNALGWVALAEFRPGLLVLDGWREMSAKDWTDCVQPLFRLCPGAKLLALGEPDAPGDSCRAAEEMLADAIVEPLALGGAMAEGLLPMPASYTALLWPLEDALARLRAEVKNLHLPGCPDPNAEKYQALSLAVEKLPPVEQLLAHCHLACLCVRTAIRKLPFQYAVDIKCRQSGICTISLSVKQTIKPENHENENIKTQSSQTYPHRSVISSLLFHK